MKRRHLMWLWGAILLLATATALMMYGAEPTPERTPVSVNFPRRLNPYQRQRMERRRVLPPPGPAADPAAEPEPAPARQQDPVLAALSGGGKRSAVVVEANAIRHSPIGKLLLRCLMDEAREDPIEKLRQETGVDLLQDLDRVAMTEDNVILSGHFANARWTELFKGRATQTSYGDSAVLFTQMAGAARADGGPRSTRNQVMASWNDQLFIVGDSEESVRQAIDRIEGRAPSGDPIINESQTYGEIYGVISAEDVARLFPREDAELAERFRAAAERIEVHVDTSRDVGVVTEVRGPDGAAVSDLGKSLGAALSLARLQAQAEGEKDLVEFLDLAKVNPDDGQFRMEMAIPLELLEKHLSRCGERRRERERRAVELQAQDAAEPDQATP